MRADLPLMAPLIASAVAAPTLATQAIVPHTIDLPLFSISKSENKNQVAYVVRVDDRCAPASDSPVWAYWKMLELGPGRTAPLLARELPAYGAAGQSVVERSAEGGKIRLTLRALPSRPIVVETSRAPGGTCRATSTVTIAGEAAYLFNVHAKLAWPLGVDYLLVQGWSLDGTRIINEKLKSK